jgi:hypothetical protein
MKESLMKILIKDIDRTPDGKVLHYRQDGERKQFPIADETSRSEAIARFYEEVAMPLYKSNGSVRVIFHIGPVFRQRRESVDSPDYEEMRGYFNKLFDGYNFNNACFEAVKQWAAGNFVGSERFKAILNELKRRVAK